jgi:hypothetical protein
VAEKLGFPVTGKRNIFRLLCTSWNLDNCPLKGEARMVLSTETLFSLKLIDMGPGGRASAPAMNFPTHFILWPRWRAQEDSTKIVTVSTKDCRWATKTTDASIAPRRRRCVVGCHCLSPPPSFPYPPALSAHPLSFQCLLALVFKFMFGSL